MQVLSPPAAAATANLLLLGFPDWKVSFLCAQMPSIRPRNEKAYNLWVFFSFLLQFIAEWFSLFGVERATAADNGLLCICSLQQFYCFSSSSQLQSLSSSSTLSILHFSCCYVREKEEEWLSRAICNAEPCGRRGEGESTEPARDASHVSRDHGRDWKVTERVVA